MTNRLKMTRKLLSCGAAMQALALLGAGIGAPAMFAVPATAQDYTNVTASGKVQGTDGKPVGGATVTITSNGKGFRQVVTTDSSGTFRAPQTPAGSYTFTVAADGYDTFTDANVTLAQASAGNVFTLASASATGADIVVTAAGRSAAADFEQTTTGAVINVADLQSRVPVARNLTSVILLSPGTNAGDSAFGNQPSISGSSVSENQFYVNGLDITDFRLGLGSVTVPFEFYDTVDVKNGGYSAEFGRSTGGFVSATTKSGSNDFHGAVLFSFRPDALSSTSPNTYAADNHSDYRQSTEADFELSGPIIKNHLFFYGLYSPRASTTGDGSITANRYDTLTTTDPFFGGKVDAYIVDGQHLEFTVFDDAETDTTNSFNFNPVTHQRSTYKSTSISTFGGVNYVGRYTGKFSNWLTLSGAYGKSNDDQGTQSTSNLPVIIDNRSGTAQSIGNPTSSLSVAQATREFYRGDIDLYFKLFGTHHIRGGYDHENLSAEIDSVYPGNGVAYQYFTAKAGNIYSLPVGTQYVSGRTFINGGTFSATNQAYYVQDDWSLINDQLTLNLGLRDDKFTDRNGSGQTFYQSPDSFAPRVGFTLDPFGNRRTKIYGYYGRYFLPLNANLAFRQTGGTLDETLFYRLNGVNADNTPVLGAPITNFPGATSACVGAQGANCSLVQDGSPIPTNSSVSKSLKPQTEDEFIFGGEQRIAQRIKVGVYGTYRKLVHSLEDTAIDPAVNAYCASKGITGCAALYSGFSQYVIINPGDAFTVTLAKPLPGQATAQDLTFTAAQLGLPRAQRTYKAMTFTFDREFDGKWGLSGSYTFAKSIGNIEGGVKSDTGQTDSNITSDFDNVGFTDGTYGYLPNDRRHNLKLYGSYQVNKYILLGAQFQLQSPRHFGCIGTAPTDGRDNIPVQDAAFYGASAFFCPILNGQVVNGSGQPVTSAISLVQRGSVFESDWNKQLDMTMTVTPIPGNRNLALQFEVFNIFNFKSALDFDEFGTDDSGAPNATYRQPLSYQQPRYVRFTFRAGF